jgi:hypothetical protein
MTAPNARQPQVLPRPACTPAVVRAVLAAKADNDVLRQYDEDLDTAFEQAREQGDLAPRGRSYGADGSRPTLGAILASSVISWLAWTLIEARDHCPLSSG